MANNHFSIGDKVRLPYLNEIFTVIAISPSGMLFCKSDMFTDSPRAFKPAEFVNLIRVDHQSQDTSR